MLLTYASYRPSYHQVLLDTAQRLIAEDKPEIAVVTAQMACEIFTEQVVTAILEKKDVAFLEEAISALLPNYNLGHEKVLKFYVALSGDVIKKAIFWKRFKEATELRNKIVHRGRRITNQQAEDTCQAYLELIQHIDGVLKTVMTN